MTAIAGIEALSSYSPCVLRNFTEIMIILQLLPCAFAQDSAYSYIGGHVNVLHNYKKT